MKIQEGVYPVYKPSGPSSNGFLNIVRRATGVKRMGHAGTLDPLARGVLVVGVGARGTKELARITKAEKEYIATICLGMESVTDDEEGEKRKFSSRRGGTNVQFPKRADIDNAIGRFKGVIKQAPPVYSAVKIKGLEAYKRARRGELFEMKARQVEIKEIEALTYQWPYLKIRVVTGSGVYIRSLARDIGRALDVGGYLADLERTRVNGFTVEDAKKSLLADFLAG